MFKAGRRRQAVRLGHKRAHSFPPGVGRADNSSSTNWRFANEPSTISAMVYGWMQANLRVERPANVKSAMRK
jgi:hypothetical protein